MQKSAKVGVLMGGISREREISFRSGKNVAEALKTKGYQVEAIDIDSKDVKNKLTDIDIAYLALHGCFGEDGEIQKILEELRIPYTGSGPQSSANCMDKVATKNILVENNLPTPDYQVVTELAEINIPLPLVLKATSEGSSFGVYICHTQQELFDNFAKMKATFNKDFFVEKYIKGMEITVGIFENKDKELIVYPSLELVPEKEFYDFEAKYTTGMTNFIIPARLSKSLLNKIEKLTIKTFQALKCAGAPRVDFIIENNKTPLITEINTIPGMTNQSDLPAVAKAAGIEFNQLVEQILLSAKIGKY